MQNLSSLFQESPEACLAEIERVLENLHGSMQGVVQRLDSMAELYEQYLKTRLPMVQIPSMDNWIYDARMAPLYFDSVYLPEVYPEYVKRWVNAGGILKTRLAMPRSRQYRFAIQIREFVSDEIENSFQLIVDGAVCPWISSENKLFSTVIPENAEADCLEFALVADPQACVHDVSFSFSTITITAI